MQIATIEAGNHQQAQEIAEQASSILREGGLVALPTETVYGIAAVAGHDEGFRRLCELKGSRPDQAYTVHIPEPGSVHTYVEVGRRLEPFIKKVFPGPVTLLIEQRAEQIERKLSELEGFRETHRGRIYSDDHTIGLRCPEHVLTRRILSLAGCPVVACAAHLPGQAVSRDASEVMRQLDGQVEMVVDGGPSRYARQSTVVRVTDVGGDLRIQVEREGVYDERMIRRLLRCTILIVCSGNTCRSPMGGALACQALAKSRGIEVEDIEAVGYNVVTAGVFAGSGMPASEEAIITMRHYGIDLSSHRSQPVTMQLVREADVVYCMTGNQRDVLIEMIPEASDKIHRLNPDADIEDPMGMDIDSYQRTAEQISQSIAYRIKEHEQ